MEPKDCRSIKQTSCLTHSLVTCH